ncbi:MAG: LamG domain-containing protein [Verrucomicrobiales bacterium]
MPVNLRAIFLILAVLLVAPLRSEPIPLLFDLNAQSAEGTEIKDTGPHGLKVEVRGNVSIGETPRGAGLVFPQDGHLRVTGGPINDAGSPLTVGFWMRPDSFPPDGHQAGVVGKRRHFWQEKPFVVLLSFDGALIVETTNGAENANFILQNQVTIGQWTHLAVTHAADGDVVVYINGEEKERKRLRGTLASNDQAIHIGYEEGKDMDNTRRVPFHGAISGLRGYAAALEPQQVKADMSARLPDTRKAEASDFADPLFIGRLMLTRYDRPVGFAQRKTLTRQKAYRRDGPNAVDWIQLTLDDEPIFERDAEEHIAVPLRTDPQNRPLFRRDYDHTIKPIDVWFRSVLWIWGRRYLYTIDPATRSTPKEMEIWTFPIYIASETGEKIQSVLLELDGTEVYNRKQELESLTLLLPRSPAGKAYRLTVNGSEAVEFEVGLEDIQPGNPQEVVKSVEATIPGSTIRVANLQRPEEFPHRQQWRQDLAAMREEGAKLEGRQVSASPNEGSFARYLGLEVPRSPITIHNVHMTHGMSGGHYWGSAQGPDALHAANTSFGVMGSLSDYAEHLAYLGIDRIIEVANDKVMADTSDDKSVESFFHEMEKRGIQAGLNVHSLQDSNLMIHGWNLPDAWDPRRRDISLLAQRFSGFRNFAALTMLGDNAGYVPYWHWAPPIPNRPWAEAMSTFKHPEEVRIPLGPGLEPNPDFNEYAAPQKAFVEYIRQYDATFARIGDYGEAARDILPSLHTSTQSFGSAPGVGAEGGWPWSSQPGREIFRNLSALQTYDWDETYSSKPLHNVALMDRARSYYPDKPAWAALDYFYLKFGPETLRRSYALALTRGIDAVGVNWISLPEPHEYARPQKVEQDRMVNHWAKRLGGVYGGTEPDAKIGILYVHEQAISRPIPPDRHTLQHRIKGSHEGKCNEALILCHAAGWPARIITVDELKRGLPEGMDAILLAGLNRFDDSWVWYEGLEEKLDEFLAGGGRIIADSESAAAGKHVSTDMVILSYIRQGEGATDRKSMDLTPDLLARNADNITMLREAMEGIAKPVAYSAEPTIWAIPHNTGNTQYVTVVNQGSIDGQSATETFKPQTGTLEWSSTRPIYDLNEGRRVAPDQVGTVDLQDTAVRVFALPAAEITTLQIAVNPGESGFYEATVTANGDISGTPLAIRIRNNSEEAELFGSTGQSILLPVSGNAPGAYSLEVEDLLAGVKASENFEVAASPTTVAHATDMDQRLAGFAQRTEVPLTIALTPAQKKDEALAPSIERLRELFSANGRTVTVRELAPFEVVEHIQTYHSGQPYPRWSTIAEDLVLIGTPTDNVLIFDQARGRVLPPYENGTVAWLGNAFRFGHDAVTLYAENPEGLSQAIAMVEQSIE